MASILSEKLPRKRPEVILKVHIDRMGRKSTKCPEFLKQPIVQSRAFPIDATADDIAAFEEAFAELVFSPGGIGDQVDKAIMKAGSEVDLIEVERPYIELLQRDIKVSHLIPQRFIDLALALGLQPDRITLTHILWRLWSRSEELRSLAVNVPVEYYVNEYPVRIAHSSLYIFRRTKNEWRLELINEESGSSGLVEKIISQKVDIGRIRICVSCRHVFWARYIAAETCSARCSDKLSNQRKKEKQYGDIQTKG